MGGLIRFVFAFVVYVIIDVGWNVSPPARNMYASLHEASGNPMPWSYGKEMATWGGMEIIAVVVFFLLIAFANSRLAIEPAVRDNDLGIAVRNSAVLGAAAYATYIGPLFMTMANWPAALIPIDIAIGALLSLITSTVVTGLTLRRKRSRAT